MKRLLTCLLVLCAMLFPLRAMAADEITAKEQLNDPGRKVGVGLGSASTLIVEEELPKAEIQYFEGGEAFEALATGKIDAYVFDRRQLQLALDSGRTGMHLLEENMDGTVHVAVGISRVTKIPDFSARLNAFIEEKKADGTLDDMFRRWVVERDETMPEIPPAQSPSLQLTVGTTGIAPPYSYYIGTNLTGYDIELAYRFAAWLGAEPRFKVYNFSGVVAAAASGDVDCVMSDMNVTPERREAMDFSVDLYEQKIGIMVRGDAPLPAREASEPELHSFSDLKGKTVSMLNGAPFEELVRSKEPEVGGFTFYNNMPDILLALKAGKTDAFLINNAISELAVNRDPALALFPEHLQDGVFGIAFAKGDKNRDVWQAAYDKIPEETKLALWKKWTGADESAKVLPEQDWPGSNGTVQAAVCDTLEPMSYSGAGGQLVGFDIEMILLMAKELDVHVAFTGMEFSSVMSSVQSGKATLGAGSIIATEERRQSVDFIDYYPAAFVLVVRAAEPETEEVTFWDGVRASFEKTFIREGRYRLFVEGVATTLTITVLSILCGTALGFCVYLLCRSGGRIANGVTRFAMWLIKGMPMVVLLMVLYYIIFGALDISGLLVSVIGFTLTFGAAVIGMLRLGVGAVDPGQYEAAFALGYPERSIFFQIILPQALPHMLPIYRDEIVGLIKATAVVGYITVQDLTKMSDIVRSRTYEAFFPLIAVSVIYFVLEGLLGSLMGKVEQSLDPRGRTRQQILKGADEDDPN